MSRRSRAAYYAQIDRPLARCYTPTCGARGARFSQKDGQYLCPKCRAELRAAIAPLRSLGEAV